ncbi:MAG: alpha/beta hydrolase [Spirochaetota bacterium]
MFSERSFSASDGRELFYRTAQVRAARAVVVIVHGFGEHSGRYLETMERFAVEGHASYAMDLRGFGRSARIRGHIERVDLVLEDLRILTQLARLEYPGKPVVLLGHSMGGLLALRQLIHHQEDYDLAITSGPAILPPENASTFMIGMSRILAAVAPLLPVSKLEEGADTRNQELREQDEHDVLIWKGGFRARTGNELLRAQFEVTNRLGEITLPLLALHGGDDRIINPRATGLVVEGVGSADVTRVVFPGLYHEVMNEPERDEVFATMFGWLRERLE